MLILSSMKQSELFTKTRREGPKDEVSKNAELLIRAGFIHKEMAGVYDFLPLGLRVINKIVAIIREEMNGIGGQEVHLSAMQDKSKWEATNRWNDEIVDIWFKTKLKNDAELGLGFTHEEPLTAIMKDHIRSYKDLPRAVYQFQNKFRNEARAKSGILRGREFLMKDLYSFNTNEVEHAKFYEKAKAAYGKIFDRLGLGDRTYVTFAAGGTFSKYSHEFQAVCEAGEDTIFVDEANRLAVNKEVMTDDVLDDLKLKREDMKEYKSIEVGNIFSLGTKFSDALGLKFKDEAGKSFPVVMGSYGIGPSRVMGTIAELWSDDKGLVWPESVAPFKIHLIALFDEGGMVRSAADRIYDQLMQKGVEVLYDDRECGAGEKFSDADLIGIPWRYVVSEKTMSNGSVEIKKRNSDQIELTKIGDLLTL